MNTLEYLRLMAQQHPTAFGLWVLLMGAAYVLGRCLR